MRTRLQQATGASMRRTVQWTAPNGRYANRRRASGHGGGGSAAGGSDLRSRRRFGQVREVGRDAVERPGPLDLARGGAGAWRDDGDDKRVVEVVAVPGLEPTVGDVEQA